MPKITVNNVELHYTDTGAGPETIVFAHGLLWSGWEFHLQVAELQSEYRCIAFDFRGQGESQVTPAGYDMDTLAEDVSGLIEKLELGRVHLVGLSMGGFVAMRVAARRPELVRSLVLIGTSADPEPAERLPWERLMTNLARWIGMWPFVGFVMRLYFGKDFLADPAADELRAECRRRLRSVNRAGASRAVRGVIERTPIRDAIAKIKAPTLVLVGEHDQLTTLDKSTFIKERIDDARLEQIAGSGHTCILEQPGAVNRALLAFFKELT